MSSFDPVEILLIEDSLDDAELTIRALRKRNLTNRLRHISDGEEAMHYLFDGSNQAFPKLILLDLKMPKVSGIEILRKLKGDPRMKVIPVVILTSSKEEQDIIESYELGVNAYIVKPVDFDKFLDAVSQVGLFWMLLNQPVAR